ncbi:MAG: glycosyltransferase [Myxococcales bacterium]|nr:glycosyltransferase [Myxococcales bacterium]
MADRRVLMLTAAWPPIGRASTRRVLRLARRLPALGWAPTILTPALETHPWSDDSTWDETFVVPPVPVHHVPGLMPSWRVRRAARRGLEGLGLGRLGSLVWRGTRGLPFPDHFSEWALPAVRAARALPTPDVVWVTGGPFGIFVPALAIARALDRPLVLDYRDPWTEHPLYPTAPVHAPRPLYVALERVIVARASGIAYVNEAIRDWHRDHFDVPPAIAVIPNGYAEEDVRSAPPIVPARPTLLYAGGSYVGRDMTGVLHALAEGFGPGDTGLQYQIFSDLDRETRAELAALAPKLAGRVAVHAPVDNATIAGHLQGASALYIVIAPQHLSAMTAKIFDYLAAGRPILGYGPPGAEVERALQAWGVGRYVHAGDRAGLIAALREVEAGALPYAPNAAALAPWSADRLGEDTAALLDRVVSSPRR